MDVGVEDAPERSVGARAEDREAEVREYLWTHREALNDAALRRARAFGVPGSAADDVAECAMAFAYFDARKCRGRVRPWVLGIAKHLAQRWWRRKKVKDRVEGLLRWFGLLAEEGLWDTSAQRAASPRDAERMAIGADLLAELPLDLREIYVLRHRDGLTLAEISEHTASPIGTVHSRLERAQAIIDTARKRER